MWWRQLNLMITYMIVLVPRWNGQKRKCSMSTSCQCVPQWRMRRQRAYDCITSIPLPLPSPSTTISIRTPYTTNNTLSRLATVKTLRMNFAAKLSLPIVTLQTAYLMLLLLRLIEHKRQFCQKEFAVNWGAKMRNKQPIYWNGSQIPVIDWDSW